MESSIVGGSLPQTEYLNMAEQSHLLQHNWKHSSPREVVLMIQNRYENTITLKHHQEVGIEQLNLNGHVLNRQLPK